MEKIFCSFNFYMFIFLFPKHTFGKLSKRKLKSLHMKSVFEKDKRQNGYKVNRELSGLRSFQLFTKELFCIFASICYTLTIYIKNLHHTCLDGSWIRHWTKLYLLQVRDHSFSTYVKFSEKLTFFTPWYVHVRVRIRG